VVEVVEDLIREIQVEARQPQVVAVGEEMEAFQLLHQLEELVLEFMD
jgi:hypothetical protein